MTNSKNFETTTIASDEEQGARKTRQAPSSEISDGMKFLSLLAFLGLAIGLSVGLGVGLQSKDCESSAASSLTVTKAPNAMVEEPVEDEVVEDPFPLPDTSFRHTPAEFDPMEALYISWPRYDYVSTLESPKNVVMKMIQGLCSCEDIDGLPCTKVIVQAPEDLVEEARAMIQADNSLAACGIQYDTNNRDDGWIRDMGPVFTKNCTSTESCESIVVDMNFDLWSAPILGSAELIRLEESLDSRIYESVYPSMSVEYSHMISEGGNREFNGKGVLMMSRSVEEYRNEKKTWPMERSEAEYMRVFGVEKIVWVDGVPANDHIAEYPTQVMLNGTEKDYVFNWGTGGHIDEVARFVDANTILVSQVSDEEVEHDTTGIAANDQKIFQNMLQQLKAATDADGNPFNVVEVPVAPIFITELSMDDEIYYWHEPLNAFQNTLAAGKKPHAIGATSYMNFIITNQVALIPEYYVEGDPVFGTDMVKKTDEEFRATMEMYLPNHTMVAINPLAVNIGGGGMHCISAHKNL